MPQAKKDLAKSTLAFLLALTSLLPASNLQLNLHCGGSFSNPFLEDFEKTTAEICGLEQSYFQHYRL